MIRSFNKWLVFTILIIFVSGIALTVWTVQREDTQLRTDLLVKVRHLSGGINKEALVELTGSGSDLGTPAYTALKDKMILFGAEDPQIQFVYLMGRRADGTVFFYVDSESPDSENYSPPGQLYPEASDTLVHVFSSGYETTEGPVSDRWGTWVSGLVPITAPRTGNVIAVLGTDIDGWDWNIQIIRASAPAVIAMLLLVLLILIFFYVLQRNEREKQLRSESEAIIRESENRYRTVFESTGTAMLTIEEDTTIGFANKEFFRLTGYSQEDIDKGRSWTEFIFKDDLEKMIQQHKLRREKPGEAAKQYEFRLITKTGELRTILLTIDMLPGTKQSIASLIDITDQKTTEASLQQYASEVTHYADTLRQTNDKLNLLNSITRHDILNQLTTILGYLELMQMTNPDPVFQGYLTKEMQAAQNIKKQITFTKEYQDIGVQSPQWFNLKKIIMANAANLPLSQINLVIHFDTLEIYADPMLEKVFYTLLENALRHGKTITSIDFSCSTTPDGLNVTCQDNGVGIPAEHKEAIFDRRFFNHTGFGLFLSRTILSITGMTIRETGEQGRGARFEIFVPAGAYRFTRSE